MSAPVYPNFFDWYHSTTSYLRAPSTHHHQTPLTTHDTFTFVIGNESCDLDSFVSSVSYAYLCECAKFNPQLMGTTEQTFFPHHLKTLFNVDHHSTIDELQTALRNHHFIPLISVPLDQFDMRGLIARMVSLMDIKHDVIPLDALTKETSTFCSNVLNNNPNGISFCLVDHNKPTSALQTLFDHILAQTGISVPVIAICDHHVDEKLFTTSPIYQRTGDTLVTTQEVTTIPRVIYVCASTTTIIVNLLYSVLTVGTGTELAARKTINQFIFPSSINENILPLLDLKYIPKKRLKSQLDPIFPPSFSIEKQYHQDAVIQNNLQIDPSPSTGLSQVQYDTLKKHQRQSLILIGDLIIFTIIVDSVGLEPKHGKRTVHDDLALSHLNRSELLPPMLFSGNDILSPTTPMSPNPEDFSTMLLGQSELTKKLFSHLSILLTDTSRLTIRQLFHLDSKTITVTTSDNEELSVLFSAVPKKLANLIDSHQYMQYHDHLSIPNNDNGEEITQETLGSELLYGLLNEHRVKAFDLILLCTYFQKETDHSSTNQGILQRELLISSFNNRNAGSNEKYDHLVSYLSANLRADAALGVDIYTSECKKLEPLLKQNSALTDSINVELFVQNNSTLSRKYMLPLITKLIQKYSKDEKLA